MNLFFREIKSHRNSLIFWSIGMATLVGSGMAKFEAYSSSGQSMSGILDQFPKTVQTIFGISGFDMSKVSGFFGIIFMYIALMATIHAILLGSDMISKEERDRTSEFLFVKPVSRAWAITAKLLAGLINLVLLNIVTLASSIYFTAMINKNHESVNHDILLLMMGLFFMQIIFFSIGAAIAGMSKKPKTAPSLATSTLLVTFFIYFLINLNDKLSFLKYLTPFKYFDAKEILANGKLDHFFMALSSAIVISMVFATYRFFSKRDLNI